MPRMLMSLITSALLFTSVACASSPVPAPVPAGASAHGTVASTNAAGPSQAAQMVCGTSVRQTIVSTLHPSGLPVPASTWSDHVFTCRYSLADGPLVLRVTESADIPTAMRYSETARAAAAPTEPITGLANLGLPAYRNDRGVVIFTKDAMTLEVDASQLPSQLGSQHITSSDFAYQLATNVLACWTGH